MVIDKSAEQTVILIASHVVHLELRGPIFRRGLADLARAVPVGGLHAVFARELAGEQQILRIPAHAAGGEPPGLVPVDIEDIFVLVPLHAVGVILVIGVVGKVALADGIALFVGAVAVVVDAGGHIVAAAPVVLVIEGLEHVHLGAVPAGAVHVEHALVHHPERGPHARGGRQDAAHLEIAVALLVLPARDDLARVPARLIGLEVDGIVPLVVIAVLERVVQVLGADDQIAVLDRDHILVPIAALAHRDPPFIAPLGGIERVAFKFVAPDEGELIHIYRAVLFRRIRAPGQTGNACHQRADRHEKG